jgi:hypothetical protein
VTCKSKLILNCCSLMNTSITLANDWVCIAN